MVRETVVTEIIGPYTGSRISGASDDVVAVRLSVVYRFDEVTIRFESIPAILDRTQGREIVSGEIASAINRIIKAIRQTVRQHNQQPTSIVDRVKKTFTISAKELSLAA